jgi:hypothetical protein
MISCVLLIKKWASAELLANVLVFAVRHVAHRRRSVRPQHLINGVGKVCRRLYWVVTLKAPPFWQRPMAMMRRRG